MCIILILDGAPVAQLDRVPGYEPGGRGFDSCPARQLITPDFLKKSGVSFFYFFDKHILRFLQNTYKPAIVLDIQYTIRNGYALYVYFIY